MPNKAYINDLPKMKYYLEYWRAGDSADQIQNCEFHSAFIDGFIRRFSDLGKYTVIYLICLSNSRVLIDRRGTWSDKSFQSLLEDLKKVDQ
jgi:hypothetical protein